MQIYFQGDKTNIKTNICVFTIVLRVVQSMFTVYACVADEVLKQSVQTFSYVLETHIFDSQYSGWLSHKNEKNENNEFVVEHMMYYLSIVFY